MKIAPTYRGLEQVAGENLKLSKEISKVRRGVLDAQNAAIFALLCEGADLDEIEILVQSSTGEWRVRKRRAVCTCGRSV